MAACDGVEEEPEDVVWVQGPTWFVDVRIARDGTGGWAFGGRTSWDPPELCWHHVIDLQPFPAPEDRARISLTGDEMIEYGQWGAGGNAVQYRERWQRVDGGTGTPWCLRRPGGIVAGRGDLQPDKSFYEASGVPLGQ